MPNKQEKLKVKLAFVFEQDQLAKLEQVRLEPLLKEGKRLSQTKSTQTVSVSTSSLTTPTSRRSIKKVNINFLGSTIFPLSSEGTLNSTSRNFIRLVC